MSLIHSFAPVVDERAHTLILGSMPGVQSLAAGQYYAHPQNAFWNIMGALFGAGPDVAYTERLRRLQAQGIAVWDVLECCVRSGSLDADIVESSIRPNDFAALYAACPQLSRVYFNGAKAEASYRRHVMPRVPAPALRLARLPSTSPAHAGLRFDAKLAAWRVLATPRPMSGGM